MPVTEWDGGPVLVTGGAGFIGANLVRRLLMLGARVRVADNLGRLGARNLEGVTGEIELVRADLRDASACLAACEGIEAVFHLASNVGNIDHYRDRPGDVLLTNTLIDAHMLDAARQTGVRRYLYASSTHVYPRQLQERRDAPALREEQALPADPPVSYGWAKLVGEQALAGLAEQGAIRGAVLRMMNPYGPYQDIDPERASAIPAFIRRAIEMPEDAPLSLRTTGEETRSFCYIDDTIEAMLLAVERIEGQTFVGPLNVGSEEPVAILDLAREAVAVTGRQIEIEPGLSRALIAGQAIDCTRAREELGWRPRVSLREGLERTHAWIHEQLREAASAPSPPRISLA